MKTTFGQIKRNTVFLLKIDSHHRIRYIKISKTRAIRLATNQKVKFNEKDIIELETMG